MNKVSLFALGIVLAAMAPAALRAQAAAAPAAHVRLWKTDLHDFPNLRVAFKPIGGRHPATQELGGGNPGYAFNSYADAPAGHGTVEVFSGAANRPLISQPASLPAGAFITVLLSEPGKVGEPPRLEIIEDDTLITDAARAQITVRSFIADLKDVHLTVGESLSAQFVSGDGFLQMRGLKPALYPVRTVGTGSDGKSFDWNMDADLRQNRHQTLLIYPDPYGRIRPRLIADGETVMAAPENKEGQR